MAQSAEGDHELWGWENYFQEIDSFIGETERQFGNCNEEYTHYAIERFEFTIQSSRRLHDHLEHHRRLPGNRESERVLGIYVSEIESLVTCLQELCRKWLEYRDMQEELSTSTAYRVPQDVSSGRGRPRFDISIDQIEYLRSLSFTWTDIASLLGVSRMTIFRRRVEFQMVDETQELVGDDELMTIVATVRRDLPNVGEKIMLGRLRSMGYYVTRERIRRAIRNTDPINSALRWQGILTQRRPYSVPGPNSLWHIGMFCAITSVICIELAKFYTDHNEISFQLCCGLIPDILFTFMNKTTAIF